MMKSSKTFTQSVDNVLPSQSFGWSGLQIHTTISYVKITLVAVFILQILRLVIFFLLTEPLLDLFPLLIVDINVLILGPCIGGFFGFVSTRDLVKRIQCLGLATRHFANGHYAYRVQVIRRDEIGELELYFNKMAEQLADSINQRQILAEEHARLAERTRISRDLHDSVKQQLFAIGMQIGTARSLIEHNSEVAAKHLVEADTLVYQAQQELTTLVQSLRPSVLQEQDFNIVLQDYGTAWGRQNDIAVDISVDGNGVLPLAVKEAFWRISQEALSNVARHSRATVVQVHLVYSLQQVILTIVDNGQGFNTPNGTQSGVGLQSMRERVEVVHGTVSIQGRPGQGTCIEVACPLP
jgi:NarL family two-component system sensor histidine kinase LiaS